MRRTRRCATGRLIAAFLLLSIAGACRRGCAASATHCTTSSECDEGLTCHRGYCSSPELIELDERCRAAKACTELGACGVVSSVTFLGLGGGVECGAVSDADCKASRACAESGNCALSDVFCLPATVDDCASSTRCKSHEACSLAERQCVRPWRTCEHLGPSPLAPWWATSRVSPVDVDRFRSPSNPGAVEGATVACRSEHTRSWQPRVRWGERCTEGPPVPPGRASVTFAQSNVRITPGDVIAVEFQKPESEGSKENSSFAKVVYQGASPFTGGTPGEALECFVVGAEAALPLGEEALRRVDQLLDQAKRERPDPRRLEGRPPSLGSSYRSASDAAVWLGWDSPHVRRRVDRIGEIEKGWSRALGPLFDRIDETATAVDEVARPAGDMSLRPAALVCGEALRARYGKRAEGLLRFDPDDCGLELLVENLSKAEVMMSWSFGAIGSVNHTQWLIRSKGRNEVVEARMIDARLTTPDSKPELAVSVPSGAKAFVLVGAPSGGLKLGRAASGERTLFRAYSREHFALRTNLQR